MSANRVFSDASIFAMALRDLRAQRRNRVVSGRNDRSPRAILTKTERSAVLAKTDGRCHICGGAINADDWQADHVLARSTGGKHAVDNYFQLIRSATIIAGTMTLKNFSGFLGRRRR
jgi:hypothetical protein